MSENNIDPKLDLALEIFLVRKTLEEIGQNIFDMNELFGHVFDILRQNFPLPREVRG